MAPQPAFTLTAFLQGHSVDMAVIYMVLLHILAISYAGYSKFRSGEVHPNTLACRRLDCPLRGGFIKYRLLTNLETLGTSH